MEKTKTLLLDVIDPAEFTPALGGNKIAAGQIIPEDVFAASLSYYNKFAVGRYFWFIADTTTGTTKKTGGKVEEMMFFSENEIIDVSSQILFRNTHPEDLPKMFAFSSYWYSFLSKLPIEQKENFRTTIYLRLLNPQQTYYWVMVQFADHIFDKDGMVIYGLTVITDISHIKTNGVAMMTVFDAKNQSCQHLYCKKDNSLTKKTAKNLKITHRQLQVLKLISAGYSSKQIASELSLSVKTIGNHRQNLLSRMSAASTAELVANSIKTGLI
ncbi:response regulator transcription factor [Parafilimonas terrae]|jgi:DNA-binding CsgD family transcriptional regulator|uniref:Regulatory protein, luxR family n=1 Tax=Parafilimonas terrae TaxID=1465490 RepID=A0A1I5VBN6_9BACT|nr:LuxR C-terminal-related transcriptional regulator [Parafilimonas terrae]SFQ04346.1 regulatory protein, luxR family [Parafilimonas terrae]